jgi:hypothetical protein
MLDEIDYFSSNFRGVFFISGPRRESIPDFIRSEREINKHQEKITHDEKCRCKQHKFNDLVVMYEHIEQYPQFRCYCEFCLRLLTMRCDKDIRDEDANHSLRFQLAGKLIITKGIDLR